jgi:F0F1-type ATP synthase delta subunit
VSPSAKSAKVSKPSIAEEANDVSELKLPVTVSSRIQLAQLVRELEGLENEFESQKAKVRATGMGDDTTEFKIPNMTRSLADCVELNQVDILSGQGRHKLKRVLVAAKEHAPTIHLTFASEIDPQSLRQIVTYVRREIHPGALISVGLQPGIVGGAYIRTPNHVHDFSLRALLQGKRGIIARELENLHAE